MPVCLLLWKTPFFVCQFKQSKLKFCHLSKVECQYQHSLKCSCSPEGKLSRNLIQWIPYSAMKVLLVVEVATITANPEYVLCARIRIMCWKPETEDSSQYIDCSALGYRLVWTSRGKQFSLQRHRSFRSLPVCTIVYHVGTQCSPVLPESSHRQTSTGTACSRWFCPLSGGQGDLKHQTNWV